MSPLAVAATATLAVLVAATVALATAIAAGTGHNRRRRTPARQDDPYRQALRLARHTTGTPRWPR